MFIGLVSEVFGVLGGSWNFEFHALWTRWQAVQHHLSETEIEDLEVVLPRIMAAPKADGTFRVVHQLDPLNAIAYTAMTFMVGQAIEQARASDRVACSYRIQLNANTGRIFREGNGYAEYLEQTRALAANNDFVLKTDITDFYNQIYLHRLQNAISSADQNLYELATDIERFLAKLNDTVSHGVPVGPSASIVMAEAVLIDVDEFMSGQGFQHIRYVDDFRIFSASMSDLNCPQQDLTLYLHNNHRLVLASGKTEIMASADFLGTVVDDPHEVERREIHAALGVIQAVNGYEFEDDQPEGLPVDVQRRAELLKVLMQRVIDIEPLDLARARRVFRQSRRYVIRAIVLNSWSTFISLVPS